MKKLLIVALLMLTTACSFDVKNWKEIFYTSNEKAQPKSVVFENKPLEMQDSVVVCRLKQCAPASVSMSREYIHNSLLQLFENNNKTTALICAASANSHTCLQNYVTVPITAGITPANMYIDSVKLTDLTIGKENKSINLLLNYNVTFNGQSPDCTTAKTLVYAKSADHIVLEDNGYYCKMTSVGQSTVKTVFAIDYIDLDYGFIGGYYSIGLSGPAYGGGVGYMLIRLQKDAHPLAPALISTTPKSKPQTKQKTTNQFFENVQTTAPANKPKPKVEVFPINAK